MSSSPEGSDDATLAVQRAIAERQHQPFRLVVEGGPNRGTTFLVDPGDADQPPRLLLGTSPACHFRLTDPTVSRRHAALELSGLRLRLCDLGSTNGTRVNGIGIGEAFLDGGERIELGETSILLSAAGPARSNVFQGESFGRVLGASEEMQRIYAICSKIAASEVPVMIEGETGTGKELLAEAIHETGARASGAFVVFDCAATAGGLAEAALFGHETGTQGGVGPTPGVFRDAHGGTLLIDEVAELDPALQAKLLRVLERGELRPLGSTRSVKVDVRLLLTTRRDLDREVQAGRFRDDLFFRIAVARVELPPLRRRRGDVELLARHFWLTLGGDPAGPDARFLRALSGYDWPGNVRELRNAVARRIALGELASDQPGTARQETALPAQGDWLDQLLDQKLPLTQARQQVLDTFLRRYVERVLGEHDGNVSRAAAASGLARRYFQILRARQRS